jgi:hypothetical protein
MHILEAQHFVPFARQNRARGIQRAMAGNDACCERPRFQKRIIARAWWRYRRVPGLGGRWSVAQGSTSIRVRSAAAHQHMIGGGVMIG